MQTETDKKRASALVASDAPTTKTTQCQCTTGCYCGTKCPCDGTCYCPTWD